MPKLKSLVLTKSAIFAAILCIISPFSIMIGPIPVTFSLFVLIFSALMLSKKEAFYAVLVYLFLGFCGLPVFSGAVGGIGALIGPTGGFLISYPLIVYVAGMKPRIIKNEFLKSFFPSVAALVCCYFFGSLWYMFVAKVPFVSAVSVCVAPFAVFDIIKIFAACLLSKSVNKRFTFINM